MRRAVLPLKNFIRILFLVFLTLGVVFFSLTLSTAYKNLPLTNGLVIQSGTLLGGDYFAFYLGGTIASRGESLKLYDLEYQRSIREELLKEDNSSIRGEMPFVYPPLVAKAFSYLAQLPFAQSFTLYAFLSFTITSLVVYRFFKASLNNTVLSLGLLMIFWGFFPFIMYTIFGGQLSWFGLLIFVGVYEALRKERDFIAGILFSLSYYKPPLFFLGLIVLLFSTTIRFLFGFISGACMLIFGTLWYVGFEGIKAYIATVSRYTYGQKLIENISLPSAQGKGIFALVTEVIGSGVLSWSILAISIGAASYILLRGAPIKRDSHQFSIWFATIVLASVSLSFQCIKYDLTILALSIGLLLQVYWKKSAQKVHGLECFQIFLLLSLYFEWIPDTFQMSGYLINLSSLILIFLLPVSLCLLKSQDTACRS